MLACGIVRNRSEDDVAVCFVDTFGNHVAQAVDNFKVEFAGDHISADEVLCADRGVGGIGGGISVSKYDMRCAAYEGCCKLAVSVILNEDSNCSGNGVVCYTALAFVNFDYGIGVCANLCFGEAKLDRAVCLVGGSCNFDCSLIYLEGEVVIQKVAACQVLGCVDLNFSFLSLIFVDESNCIALSKDDFSLELATDVGDIYNNGLSGGVILDAALAEIVFGNNVGMLADIGVVILDFGEDDVAQSVVFACCNFGAVLGYRECELSCNHISDAGEGL